MEFITGILDKIQPGTSDSILYQFVLFAVLFTLLKHLFFNKLLFVIENRESKTTKLDEAAGNKFKEADKLSQKFDQEIQQTSQIAHQKMSEMKNESLKKIMTRQKQEETKIISDYEEKKKVAINEIKSKRDDVLKSSEALSQTLIEKLVN